MSEALSSLFEANSESEAEEFSASLSELDSSSLSEASVSDSHPIVRPFDVIYADPPWQYKVSWGNGSNEHTYPTMTTADIMGLPVKDIVSKDAHLWLWVTNPFLQHGLDVCKAWGFEYKTLLTWVKTYKDGTPECGMGYYLRGSTEHLILGVRGKRKMLNKTTKNVVPAVNPRWEGGKHSQKPQLFRDLVVSCSGDIPRAELFARQSDPGWTSLGNGMNGCDIRDELAEYAASLKS